MTDKDKINNREDNIHEWMHNPEDDGKLNYNLKFEMKRLNETEMEDANLTKDEEVDKLVVRRAFCQNCGEELISKTPQLFNPYTLESICKHTCSKCGSNFNLEYAYPRIVFLDKNGEEIKAFTC